MSIDGLNPSVAPNCETAVRSASSGTNASPARAIVGRTSATAGGIVRSAPISRGEGLPLGDRCREATLEHQEPHVFERPLLREVDRAVLAIVVEAFEAAHVADSGLGDDDALEAARDLVRLGIGRLDHRDAHEVAHRHDADEPVGVDHRDVPVPVLRELREGGACLDV